MIEVSARGLVTLVAVAVASCSGRAPAPAALSPSGCPAVALQAFVPFNSMLGFDAPLFVLYRDGLAIYGGLGDDGLTPSFRVGQLTAHEQTALLDSVRRGVQAPPESTPGLPMSDQVTYRLDANIDGAHTRVSYTEFLPPPIRFLLRYGRPEDVSWLPDTFQVVIHLDTILARTQADTQAKPWPSQWPGLGSTRASHADPRERTLTLPFTEFATLRRLRPTDAPWIRIEGQLGLVGYRIPFPCESWWQADSV